MNDSKVFAEVVGKIKQRMVDLDIDINRHTMVFDRGCNSKKNLSEVSKTGIELCWRTDTLPPQRISERSRWESTDCFNW